MVPIDYRRFDERQLDELLEQLKRSEEDLQRRLAARLDVPDLPKAHGALDLDRIAKRLWFLLAKVSNKRRAVERELGMRQRNGKPSLCNIDDLDFERPGTEEPPVIGDNVSSAPRRTASAVVA